MTILAVEKFGFGVVSGCVARGRRSQQLSVSSSIQDSCSSRIFCLREELPARALKITFSDALTVQGRFNSLSFGGGGDVWGKDGVWQRLVYAPQVFRKARRGPRAQMGLDPGGGDGGEDDNRIVRTVVNLALAGGLTYLTVTGKLGWVFDAIISLWLLAVLVPVVGVVAFLWFAEREIVRGACPNCGNEFQVFEFTVKDGEQCCPFCSQPFRVENKQFVRDGPHFSERQQQYGGFNPFDFGLGSSTAEANKRDPPGVIVDVEAEVRDRD